MLTLRISLCPNCCCCQGHSDFGQSPSLQKGLHGGDHKISYLWYSEHSLWCWLEWRGIPSCCCRVNQVWEVAAGLLCYPCLNFYKNAMVEFLVFARILRSAFMGTCVTKKLGKNLREAEGGSFCLSTHSLISVFNNIFYMHQGSKIHQIKWQRWIQSSVSHWGDSSWSFCKKKSCCTFPEKPFLSLQIFCLIGYVPSVVLFTYVVSFTFRKVQNTKEFWSFIFSVVSDLAWSWDKWGSPKPQQKIPIIVLNCVSLMYRKWETFTNVSLSALSWVIKAWRKSAFNSLTCA